jgi:protoporphyrin/coproporphyrin ferrochelatase
MIGPRTDRTGVLVMAHGTPADPSGVEAFYTRIRRGRPPSPGQLADLERRYAAIGGTSPLAARTAAQVAGIAAVLEAAEPGAFVVGFGAKHTDPSIEEGARGLAATGVGRVVGVVLTPHRASMGADEYLDRAEAALASVARPPSFVRVPQWFDEPGFAALVAERVRAARSNLGPVDRSTVLFTAHSLPRRVVDAGDPYPEQVAASAAAVAGLAGLDADHVGWSVAWQSAGRTPEPWIGPDLLEVVRTLGATARDARARHGVVVCPIGFVADHLEVLYDVDIEARQVAASEGLAFTRTASLNEDPRFCAIVAGAVRTAGHDGAAAPGPGAAG